jgi:hypothetical protein
VLKAPVLTMRDMSYGLAVDLGRVHPLVAGYDGEGRDRWSIRRNIRLPRLSDLTFEFGYHHQIYRRRRRCDNSLVGCGCRMPHTEIMVRTRVVEPQVQPIDA